MDNRKKHEATTSFGEVMRTAGVPTQQQNNKRMPEDTRLMILCQGMRIYIPDNFQTDTLLNLCQTLKMEIACEIALANIRVPRYHHLKAILSGNQDKIYLDFRKRRSQNSSKEQ